MWTLNKSQGMKSLLQRAQKDLWDLVSYGRKNGLPACDKCAVMAGKAPGDRIHSLLWITQAAESWQIASLSGVQDSHIVTSLSRLPRVLPLWNIKDP